MASPQSLSEAERRLVARWAAVCASHVLPLYESQVPGDTRPQDSIERTRAYACGALDTAAEIRDRFKNGGAAREAPTAVAAAAARSAGQAAAVAHMGAHALGAAAYAAKAVGLASEQASASAGLTNAAASEARQVAVADEIRWQLAQLSDDERAVLRTLPLVGENASGPLGAGLLSSGQLGENIATLQRGL